MKPKKTETKSCTVKCGIVMFGVLDLVYLSLLIVVNVKGLITDRVILGLIYGFLSPNNLLFFITLVEESILTCKVYLSTLFLKMLFCMLVLPILMLQTDFELGGKICSKITG